MNDLILNFYLCIWTSDGCWACFHPQQRRRKEGRGGRSPAAPQGPLVAPCPIASAALPLPSFFPVPPGQSPPCLPGWPSASPRDTSWGTATHTLSLAPPEVSSVAHRVSGNIGSSGRGLAPAGWGNRIGQRACCQGPPWEGTGVPTPRAPDMGTHAPTDGSWSCESLLPQTWLRDHLTSILSNLPAGLGPLGTTWRTPPGPDTRLPHRLPSLRLVPSAPRGGRLPT